MGIPIKRLEDIEDASRKALANAHEQVSRALRAEPFDPRLYHSAMRRIPSLSESWSTHAGMLTAAVNEAQREAEAFGGPRYYHTEDPEVA